MKKIIIVVSIMLALLLTGCNQKAVEYTVVFNTAGGTEIEDVIVTEGNLLSEKSTSYEGHEFNGWYKDQAYTEVMDFDQEIDSDITLYAKWDVMTYTITAKDHDGTVLEEVVQEYGFDLSNLNLSAPTRIGHAFLGWYMDESYTEMIDFENQVTEDIMLYAKWEINAYNITTLDHDGLVLEDIEFEYGTDLSNLVLLSPNRVGYTFDGWDLALPDTMTSDIVLTAQYSINSYLLQYVEADGTVLQSTSYEYGADLSAVELMIPSKEGHTFDGYDIGLPSSMPSKDVVLTARYVVNTYVLTFLDYDGSIIQSDSYDFGTDLSTIDVPSSYLRGHTFDGYDMELPVTMPSADFITTAQYTINSYLLNFVDYDGTIIQSTAYDYDTDLSGLVIEDPIRKGLLFTEWSDAIPNEMPNRNVMIYAKYELDLSIEENLDVAITNSTLLPFDNESFRYVLDETQELEIFYEENGAVPYVDIEAFLEFLDGSIDYSLLSFTYGVDTLTIEYTQDSFVFDGYLANGTFEATFDFTENTVTVSSFDFFRGYQVYSSRNPFENIIYQSHEATAGSVVTIPLGDYNIDLTMYNDGTDDHHLIPFHIANLLFLHSHRFNLYYNGVKITGYDDAYVAWDEDELDPALYEMNFGPLNEEELPMDLRVASFHYLALAFDYFHGVSNEFSEGSAYDNLELEITNPAESEDEFGEAIWRTLINVDDPGTWYSRVGYYDNRPLYYYEPSFNDSHERIQDLFMQYYNAKVVIDQGLGTNIRFIDIHIEDTDDYLPEVRLINEETIAIIYLVEFYDETPDQIKAILDGLPATVTSVVFDTSVSFFGKPQVALEILGFMTDQPIEYTVKDTFDGSITTYTVTINQAFYDYEYYIISSGFTYGMANIFIQIAKDNGLAIHLGLETNGGSSPLTSGTASDGSNFIMTLPMMFISREGNEIDGYTYVSYEFGIMPDIILQHYATEAAIIAAISG